MPIPLLDLAPLHEELRKEISAAFDRVLSSQQFILGPEVEEFEHAVAEWVGAPHAIGVASGSDALLLSLMALDVGPGDLVLTTPFTFFATVGAIVRLGARPLFADIDPATYNLAPDSVERLLAERKRQGKPLPRAMIPVHLFGQCADMGRLMDLARDYGMHVIEDAAQAMGATYQGKQAGTMGTFGCLSFFPTKNLGGLGDGGLVTTWDASLADRVRLLRAHGARPKYIHHEIGINSRLDTVQAAILLVKLRHLDRMISERRAAAARYRALLRTACPPAHLANVTVPEEAIGCLHTYNLYVMRFAQRDRIRQSLAERGIQSAVYYPLPMHRQECLRSLLVDTFPLPEAERAAREVLALPLYPGIRPDQQAEVVRALCEAVSAPG